MKTIILNIFFVIVSISLSIAQTDYALIPDESLILVKGTSSLHDWEMKVSDMKGKVSFREKENKLEGIEDISFSLRSKSILSENKVMDDKAHEALKAEKNPEIRFIFKSGTITNASKSNISGNISGTLLVAGKSKPFSIPFQGKMSDPASFRVSGNTKLLMSDFDMTPPKAMLGAIKTGDEVKIEFDLFFKTDQLSRNK
jgi:polyisoprenoid-binding protein YceI